MAERFSETMELREDMVELREGFARELKEPYQDSYFKKLQRVAGAFVLASITALTPNKAMTPEISKDVIAAESILSGRRKYLEKADFPLYQRVLEAIQAKGGVVASPDLSETIFKTWYMAPHARRLAFEEKNGAPYFLKPEIILGEEFVRKNPEMAARYLEKIYETMRATFMVKTHDGRIASGVTVKTGKDVLFITNYHVVGGENDVEVSFLNGFKSTATVVFEKQESDLVILRIFDFAKTEKFIKPIKFDAAQEPLRKRDKLASVGMPLGFPFEVSVSEFHNFEHVNFILPRYKMRSYYTALVHTPDDRFKKLAIYADVRRGKENLPGMSGGPLVKLDDTENGAKLVGINSFYNSSNFTGGAVALDVIKDFVEEYRAVRGKS